MEQKDYISREIEKLGLILRAISQKIFRGNEKMSINIEKQVDDTKGVLVSEIGFDIDKFVDLDIEDYEKYLGNYKGFNIDNIELLADFSYQIGLIIKSDKSKRYLEKALQLYQLIIIKSKTYSFEREMKVLEIKKRNSESREL